MLFPIAGARHSVLFAAKKSPKPSDQSGQPPVKKVKVNLSSAKPPSTLAKDSLFQDIPDLGAPDPVRRTELQDRMKQLNRRLGVAKQEYNYTLMTELRQKREALKQKIQLSNKGSIPVDNDEW
jgi:hypothetical protein